MVVNLGDRVAVSPVRLCALAVGLEDALVGAGRTAVQPGKESRSDVERDVLEVVDDVEDALVLANPSGGRVGRVALPCDPLVPVVIGRRRVLDLDRFKPRVLARRLVEMAVDRNEAFAGRSAIAGPLHWRARICPYGGGITIGSRGKYGRRRCRLTSRPGRHVSTVVLTGGRGNDVVDCQVARDLGPLPVDRVAGEAARGNDSGVGSVHHSVLSQCELRPHGGPDTAIRVTGRHLQPPSAGAAYGRR